MKRGVLGRVSDVLSVSGGLRGGCRFFLLIGVQVFIICLLGV